MHDNFQNVWHIQILFYQFGLHFYSITVHFYSMNRLAKRLNIMIYLSLFSIAPNEVPLVVKGTIDPCSSGKDIIFRLVGFMLEGQVCNV